MQAFQSIIHYLSYFTSASSQAQLKKHVSDLISSVFISLSSWMSTYFCPHLWAWLNPPQCPWVFQNRSLSPSPSSPSKVSSQPSANWIFRKSKSNYSLEKAIHHSWYVHCKGLARSFFSFWFWKVAWTNSITSASFWKSFLAAPPPLTLALLWDENLKNQKNTTNADPTKQWDTFAIWLLPTHLGVEFELLTDPPLLALLLLVIPPTNFVKARTCS